MAQSLKAARRASSFTTANQKLHVDVDELPDVLCQVLKTRQRNVDICSAEDTTCSVTHEPRLAVAPALTRLLL